MQRPGCTVELERRFHCFTGSDFFAGRNNIAEMAPWAIAATRKLTAMSLAGRTLAWSGAWAGVICLCSPQLQVWSWWIRRSFSRLWRE
jgi:hypothetical protein